MEDLQRTQIKDVVREYLLHENVSFITREQTLDLLCIGRSTLKTYVNDGLIKEYRFGMRNYYNKTQILNSIISGQ